MVLYKILLMLSALMYSSTFVLAITCVLNPFYQPICGSDNRTYGNRDILNCYNKHRPLERQISAVANRECRPLICTNYNDLQGPWPNSRPVCTNTGYTYATVHQVRCLIDFLPSLRILHEGGCTLFEVRNALQQQDNVIDGGGGGGGGGGGDDSGYQDVERKACKEPRKLFENNPICTKNDKNFQNPFQALCNNSVVVGAGNEQIVREKVGGICGGSTQRSCQRAREIQRTIRLGSIVDRTKWIVCGSDRRTYRSKYHLECARRFNNHLYTIHRGRCKNQTDPCPEKLKYIKEATPVCGSDMRSYTSFESLICAQRRMSKNLKFLHEGACIRRT